MQYAYVTNEFNMFYAYVLTCEDIIHPRFQFVGKFESFKDFLILNKWCCIHFTDYEMVEPMYYPQHPTDHATPLMTSTFLEEHYIRDRHYRFEGIDDLD